MMTQWRTEGGLGGFNPPLPPKFRSFNKAEPSSQFRGKYIRNNLIRIQVSIICKLCVTPDWGLPPPDLLPPALCPQLNLLYPTPHEQNSWVSHCDDVYTSKHVGSIE
jgi:hypothetical protein